MRADTMLSTIFRLAGASPNGLVGGEDPLQATRVYFLPTP